MTDANSHTTQYAYDTRGRRTTTTFADSTISTQDYDAAGNLIETYEHAGEFKEP